MDLESLHIFFLNYINTYSGLPGILFFLHFRKRIGKTGKLIFLILLASFLADFINYILIWIIRIRDYYPTATSYLINNVWFLVNFFIVTLLFLVLIPNRRRSIKLFRFIFIVIFIFSFLLFFSIWEANPAIRVYSSIIFIFFCLASYKEILEFGPMENQMKYPIFWIISAIFLFHSGNLLKNAVLNYLIFDLNISSEQFRPLAIVTPVLNTLKNLTFFYALILIKKGYPDYIIPEQQR